MVKELRPALVLFVLFSAITGIAYPLLVAAIAQAAMPQQANGSLILRQGKPIGSALIGQPFTDSRYFWGRPSATRPQPYDAMASSGSNLGPTNPELIETAKARLAALRAADPGNASPVPVDLVAASASGLDPHISPAAAEYQVPRVARLRGLDPQRLRVLVAEHTQARQFGLFGEARVNVLQLNLALDAQAAVP